ncbi:MAG: hypothetical protein A2X64_02725 [Ignavibacteria bacterium GWF2_33_9]|nr:MAG: hypothetical protein A2X64_02725 [Ignavibacteria bacterium GWF2_33_9]
MYKFLEKLFNKDKQIIIQTDDFEKLQEAKNLINSEIKHFINSHNGKIYLLGVRENNVYIQLKGSCSNCPAIEITLRGFIEKKMRENLAWFNILIKI